MNKMKIEILIAYLEDYKNLYPGKQLYIGVASEIKVFSDKDLTQLEATI